MDRELLEEIGILLVEARSMLRDLVESDAARAVNDGRWGSLWLALQQIDEAEMRVASAAGVDG